RRAASGGLGCSPEEVLRGGRELHEQQVLPPRQPEVLREEPWVGGVPARLRVGHGALRRLVVHRVVPTTRDGRGLAALRGGPRVGRRSACGARRRQHLLWGGRGVRFQQAL
ncbi:unnamed protein product, partial [Prorocentrum cordatum]